MAVMPGYSKSYAPHVIYIGFQKSGRQEAKEVEQ